MLKSIFKSPIVKLIAVCFLVVSTVVSVAFAWFGIKQSGGVYIITGDIQTNTKIYYGNDENKDGYLDGGNYSLRSDILNYKYTELTKNPLSVDQTTFEDINYGRCIVYKIVIENPEINGYDIVASVNMNNLFEYFYEQLEAYAAEETDSDDESFEFSINGIKNYAARLLFCFDELSYTVYECTETDTNFNTVYTPKTNISIPNNDYFLWNYSNKESFISNVTIPSGKLVEIDFKIKYTYNSQNMTNYMLSLNNETSLCHLTCVSRLIALGYSEEEAESLATSYISKMCQEEQACLSATSDFSMIELNLIISNFEIQLEQAPTI